MTDTKENRPDLSFFNVIELAVLRKEHRDFREKHGSDDIDEEWIKAVDEEIKNRMKNND